VGILQSTFLPYLLKIAIFRVASVINEDSSPRVVMLGGCAKLKTLVYSATCD